MRIVWKLTLAVFAGHLYGATGSQPDAAQTFKQYCASCHGKAATAGINLEQLIASHMSVPEIRDHIGADSLGYLSIDGLVEAIGLPESTLCNACFHGRYPLPIETGQGKFVLERP